MMKNAEMETIRLNEPNKERGLPFMEALSVRASAQEWYVDQDLSLQDLSDLLWAANGLNRPEEKKYTASSAQNAHDVDIYLFMKDYVYRYNANDHVLEVVLTGDYRSQIMMTPPAKKDETNGGEQLPQGAPCEPPIQIILVSDISRFRIGPAELKYEWGAIDVGIVSQNISLFCAATGIKTKPKASVKKEKARELLKLKDTEHVFLNHPIGY